jgi:hypothetical protein
MFIYHLVHLNTILLDIFVNKHSVNATIVNKKAPKGAFYSSSMSELGLAPH